MNRPKLEVADVLRTGQARFLARYGASVSLAQRRVFEAILACRTAVLGGHVTQCNHCDHQEISYNSCRNRHCPKCQGAARAAWLEARAEELLPVPYFHVVFTLPNQLAPIALQNPTIVYGLLFRAAAETLLEVAANPRHLGATLGVLAVLHTWGQNLMHHPHVHCVVPGGGISLDKSRWVSCRPTFFLPVRVLSKVFRGKFLSALRMAFDRGRLSFHGQLEELGESDAFVRRLQAACDTEWVVYAKRPFGGPAQVLKYLARYTHRVAISNNRLLSLDGDRVTFRWKDYSENSLQKSLTLDTTEFIRRFLQHVVPKGFVRIRQYGFLANRQRQAHLAECRRLLAVPTANDDQAPVEKKSPEDSVADESKPEPIVCPACRTGRMVVLEIRFATLPRFRWLGRLRPRTVLVQRDTS